MSTSMSIEAGPLQQYSPEPKISRTETQTNKSTNLPLILVSCFLTTIGLVGGPLLVRLYFLNGGNRKWLISSMQTAGFPLLLIPISLLIFFRSPAQGVERVPFSSILLESKLIIFSALMGILLGIDNFLYSLGLSYLPVSTATILQSTQLAFVALFSRLIVKQRFTAYIVNSVVLMTLGSVMLGIRANGDKPVGVSTGQYWLGFFLILVSAALIGIMWPTVELSYSKATRAVNCTTLMQYQLNVAFFATAFSVIGMIVSKDFQAMDREASEFKHGKGIYRTVLVATAILFQVSFVGSLGLIFFAGSLFTGIFIAVLVPLTEIASFIAYHENFTGEKGMSLALCLWAFASYFYGEYKKRKDMNHNTKLASSDPLTTNEIP